MPVGERQTHHAEADDSLVVSGRQGGVLQDRRDGLERGAVFWSCGSDGLPRIGGLST